MEIKETNGLGEYKVSKKLPKGRTKHIKKPCRRNRMNMWKDIQKEILVKIKKRTTYRSLYFLREALCTANKSIKTFLFLSSTPHSLPHI